MTNLTSVQNSIRAQWDKMIANGQMPVIEYQLSDDDFLICDIELSDDNEGLIFSFDKDPLCDVYFSGEIEQVCYNYQLTIDEYTDNLDHYLQMIDSEMTEGYLLPNGLYYADY